MTISINIDQYSQETQSFSQGEVIFEEGGPGKLMYFVKQGEVEIVKNDKVIETVPPGGIFGEMALIDFSTRSATARAKTDCQLVPIDEYRFLFLVQHAPFFSLQVMRIIVDRLRARMND